MAYITTITNKGLEIVSNLISGLGGTVPKYIGYGTGTTEASVTDVGLETPAAEARTMGTVTRQTTNTTNDTVRVVGLITCTTSPKAITEVALFDADTDGNCFLHANFAPINLNVGDSINFTINDVNDQA